MLPAHVCLQGICAGVSKVLSKTPAELSEMGQQARALFEADRAAFVDNMKDVFEDLRDLIQVAAAAVRMEAASSKQAAADTIGT
jgi:uncharacterized membrane protein